MLRVGLTGGYATGKSFVAAELSRLGCHVVYADELGHAALRPGGEAYRPAVDLFGPGILSPDGVIDRKRLGAIVFADPALLRNLNDIVHPAVFRLEEEMFKRFAAQDPTGIAVIEAAILVETGRHLKVDRLIVTECSLETQIERAMGRDHSTREQVIARIGRQMPAETKRRYAHYVIDTDRPKVETARAVEDIFRDLRKLAKGSAE